MAVHSRLSSASLRLETFLSSRQPTAQHRTLVLLLLLLFNNIWFVSMDPLSITVSVLSLVARSITTIQTCQSYASKYQGLELSLSSLRTECSAISLALSQIQKLIVRNQRRNVEERFEELVLTEYQSVLSGCQLVFSTLNERLSELGLTNESNLKDITIWSKVKLVWNEPQLASLRGDISSQANAIGILLSVFQAYVQPFYFLFLWRGDELI